MSYTPGLYTKKQVKSYISGELPAEYENNFDNYVYVVWEVTVTGSATQPWNLRIQDSTTHPSGSGQVVGYLRKPPSSTEANQEIDPTVLSSGKYAGYITGMENKTLSAISQTFRVVTAYPKSQVTEGTVLTNNINVVLEPYDQTDTDQTASASATWSYKNYYWVYRGNSSSVSKYASGSASSTTYKGWLEVYEYAALKGEDKGDFKYTTISNISGYSRTHIITGDDMGKAIPGATYTVTTADDSLYAYSSNDADTPVMLSEADYYFSAVTVNQTDMGYDVWEDQTAAPEASQGLEVYAMFAGSTAWELVATVPWTATGIMEYIFTPADLARQPYRVKAVHNTVNYSTSCRIDLAVRIRHNSPVFANMMAGDPESITVQNISGVIGEEFLNGTSQGYFHTQSESQYSQYPSDLAETTRSLYGVLTQRQQARSVVTGLLPKAASYKTAKATNDSQNSRVRVVYTLTGYDGYEIYSKDAIEYLTAAGRESPGRNEVVFYDLLPYGVQFDPSVAIIAGRTTTIDNAGVYRSQSSYWDSSQVTVTVDSNTDIIPNYNGTGRTMVCFHISYSGAESAFHNNQLSMWLEGWGVSFGAYYEWKDAAIVSQMPNISALMPAKEDNNPWLGTIDEVSQDNGVVPAGLESIYKDFGADIDRDGNLEERTVLYANATDNEDIALSSESKIEKLVRADTDRFGVFANSAVVGEGEGYTYEITLSNSSRTLENVVIFDHLENAAVDRYGTEGGFDTDWWYGTFVGIQTRALDQLGIAPLIYYNESRDALLPGTDTTAAEVLTAANGWYRADAWTASGKTMADVKSFAVDITNTTSGEKFLLETMDSVSFQVQMKAPEGADQNYAYNNPAFYSYDSYSSTSGWLVGNSAKVKLGEARDLEVQKTFDGQVPVTLTGTRFEYTAYKEIGDTRSKWANQEYTLYQLDSSGQWQQLPNLHATDSNGLFYLTAGQKAVFAEVPDIEGISIEETHSIYWQQTVVESEDETIKNITFYNRYQPVLYAQKKGAYVPSGVDVSNEVFTFQLLVDGVPLANSRFWYVSSVRTDGGEPTVVTTLGDNGTGMTDADGKFTIKIGEIIALTPGDPGIAYTLKEVAGAGETDNWFCPADTVKGIVPTQGVSATITNYYRWKDLYLTKKITYQDAAECTESFTFRITDADGHPVTGNTWVLMVNGIDTEITGTLDVNGEFTCACAGGVVRIEGLDAGMTYMIEETDSGELYQAVNGGITEVTMPKYGTSEEAELTNEYLKRPLSVTKIVLYDEEDPDQAAEVKNKEFIMTAWVGGELLQNITYSLSANGVVIGTYQTDANGRFTLKSGQTATFKDVGMKGDSYTVQETPDDKYGQIFPADQANHAGNLTEAENAVTFINGISNGNLMIRKEYVGEDEAGKAAVDAFKEESQVRSSTAVSLTLEVTTAAGDTYIWPAADQTVDIIDDLTGNMETVTWPAGGPIVVEPWKTVNLTGLENGLTYKLSESTADQQHLLEWQTGSWVEIDQKTPGNYQAFTGRIGENPLAVIVNNVKGVSMNGSRIHKQMKWDSETVPTGAALVWRVEEYDGTVWNPKSGLSYLTFDGVGPTCTSTLVTGSNGLITLKKTDYEYPIVQFTEATVKLNYITGMSKGDLRMVEVLEESDSVWGSLVGYVTASGVYGLHISADEAVGFVNANLNTVIEIEKSLDTGENAYFTMILEQVLSTTVSPVTDKSQILLTQTHGGMPYSIFDSTTNELVGENVTTADGKIVFKAGQYVKVEIPDQTLWTVREQIVQPYNLVQMTGSPENELTKLDTNLMLVQPPSDAAVPIELTKEMVISGVQDARTGRHVDLTQGDVVIPDLIIYNNELRVITSIGDIWGGNTTSNGAFVEQTGITSIVIPNTVTYIGAYSFYQCTNLTNVEIPGSVETISKNAFSYCSGLTSVIVPEGVEAIQFSAFAHCTGLQAISLPSTLIYIGDSTFFNCNQLTSISIPDSVTSVGTFVFAYCTSLTDVYLSAGLTSIQASAFRGNTSLTTLVIPSAVMTIHTEAFYGCSALTSIIINKPTNSIANSPWGAPSTAVVTWTD